jgi:hypothetical protein
MVATRARAPVGQAPDAFGLAIPDVDAIPLQHDAWSLGNGLMKGVSHALICERDSPMEGIP